MKSLLQYSTTPLLLVFLLLVSCQRSQPPGDAEPKIWREFSGQNAFDHVQKLVDCGPRPPASEGIEKSRVYIIDQLQRVGWKVERQEFTDDTPQGKIRFVNLIARWPAPKKVEPSFLLCSHYDTKTFYDQIFVGANDGGSSTGLLMEMGRVLGQHPLLAARVELVFFDGEEAYESFTAKDGLYGSRYFAGQLDPQAVRQIRGGILFDMVGDRSLDITLPPDSPSEMARDIFASAEALKFRKHFTYHGYEITDDHKPLNAVGIPTIDLIDFDYSAWHTPGDTMDKISAESLGIVGSVTVYYLEQFAFKQAASK